MRVMNHRMVSLRRWLRMLVMVAVALQLVATVFYGASWLLDSMHDATGARWLRGGSLLLGGLWLADVGLLVIVLVVEFLDRENPSAQ